MRIQPYNKTKYKPNFGYVSGIYYRKSITSKILNVIAESIPEINKRSGDIPLGIHHHIFDNQHEFMITLENLKHNDKILLASDFKCSTNKISMNANSEEIREKLMEAVFKEIKIFKIKQQKLLGKRHFLSFRKIENKEVPFMRVIKPDSQKELPMEVVENKLTKILGKNFISKFYCKPMDCISFFEKGFKYFEITEIHCEQNYQTKLNNAKIIKLKNLSKK